MTLPAGHPFRHHFPVDRDKIRTRAARRRVISAIITWTLICAALLVAVWLSGHLDPILPSAHSAAAAVRA